LKDGNPLLKKIQAV